MSRGTGASRTAGRGAIRSALAAFMALALLLVATATASAHTPTVTLTCQSGLYVNLAAYNGGGTNTVAVSIDGVAVQGSPFSFGGSFTRSWTGLSATAPHTAVVSVYAWDDPSGSNGWTRTFNKSLGACQTPTPTPTPVPTPTPTPVPTPTPLPCQLSSFSYSVAPGQNAYPMLTVNVSAKGTLAQGCTFSFSLNSYNAEGPTWPTSGTQTFLDHDSITLSASKTSGTLTVMEPACYGQTDFYQGTTRFDGVDGAVPHYPGTVTPTGLISYSNGGVACATPTPTPVPTPTPTPVPTPTPTPVPTPTPTPVPTPTPTPVPTPTPTVEPTPTPTATPDPTPTPTVEPTPTPTAVPTPTPTATPTGTPEPEVTPTPTATPQPTKTPKPSGSVVPATGTPRITPPATDTSIGTDGATGSGLGLVLLLLGGASFALMLLPGTRRSSRRR